LLLFKRCCDTAVVSPVHGAEGRFIVGIITAYCGLQYAQLLFNVPVYRCVAHTGVK